MKSLYLHKLYKTKYNSSISVELVFSKSEWKLKKWELTIVSFLSAEVINCLLEWFKTLIMVSIKMLLSPNHLIIMFICLNQIAKCFQQECSKYFDGFYLDDSYNRHVPPNISTIFDLQHVQDIVKVSILHTIILRPNRI